MILGKGLYDSSPLWAQTLAVNLTSATTFRRKYGRVFHTAFEQLAKNEKKSLDQLQDEQAQAVRKLLRYALEHVPYYRARKFSPDNLSDWPVLDKQTVAAAPEQFLSDEFSLHRLASLETSGTTGTPLTVRFTNECHQFEMAFRWRHKAWGDVLFPSRSAYLSGHPVVPAGQSRPPFWRVDYIEKRLLCSSYHFAPQNLKDYIEALTRYAPEVIHGYPSSLYLLAQFMIEHSWQSLRPRAVFTASETLLEFQREAIERAFGAKVFNWYGTTEMTCNIVECAFGGLHHRTDYGVLELQEGGEIVATGLNNPAMPLIRYRAGDIATARPGKCECGCAFPLIDRIEGRIEDYIHTPDGRLVGRLDHIFKVVRHVREAQIVQTKLDELVLRVVRGDGYSADDEKTMLSETHQRLDNSMCVRFEYVDAIERGAGGKFHFVVSEIGDKTDRRDFRGDPSIRTYDEPRLAHYHYEVDTGTPRLAEQVRDLFNEQAEAWSRMYRPHKKMVWRLDEFYSSLASIVPPAAHVLDLGCGTGNLANHLRQHGYIVTACDIADKMIAAASSAFEGSGIEWVALPIKWQRLPFEDGAFDGVVASSVFEYLDDYEHVFGELARVLRQGGALIFSVPNPDHSKRKFERQIRRLVTARYLRRIACSVPRMRRHVNYLDLSKNHLSSQLWKESAARHGFRSFEARAGPLADRPLMLLSLQREH